MYVRINYRFNGSMTKNVKGGLGAGNAGPTSGLLVSLKMRMESGWGGWGEERKRKEISLYLTQRIYKGHLHPSQLFICT